MSQPGSRELNCCYVSFVLGRMPNELLVAAEINVINSAHEPLKVMITFSSCHYLTPRREKRGYWKIVKKA